MGWPIKVDARSPVPIYEQVAGQLRRLILTGRAAPNAQLPSVRELAAHVGVNPLTIARGYVQLEHEGYVVSRVGRGTFVAPAPPRLPEAERRRELQRHVREFVRDNRWLIRTPEELRGLLNDELA